MAAVVQLRCNGSLSMPLRPTSKHQSSALIRVQAIPTLEVVMPNQQRVRRVHGEHAHAQHERARMNHHVNLRLRQRREHASVLVAPLTEASALLRVVELLEHQRLPGIQRPLHGLLRGVNNERLALLGALARTCTTGVPASAAGSRADPSPSPPAGRRRYQCRSRRAARHS